MELWIRSQDKEILTKVNKRLDIEEIRKEVSYLKDFKDNHYLIENEDYILGTYQTKERALEILNEIQDLDIKNNPNIKVNCYAYSLIRVIYEMPKE